MSSFVTAAPDVSLEHVLSKLRDGSTTKMDLRHLVAQVAQAGNRDAVLKECTQILRTTDPLPSLATRLHATFLALWVVLTAAPESLTTLAFAMPQGSAGCAQQPHATDRRTPAKAVVQSLLRTLLPQQYEAAYACLLPELVGCAALCDAICNRGENDKLVGLLKAYQLFGISGPVTAHNHATHKERLNQEHGVFTEIIKSLAASREEACITHLFHTRLLCKETGGETRRKEVLEWQLARMLKEDVALHSLSLFKEYPGVTDEKQTQAIAQILELLGADMLTALLESIAQQKNSRRHLLISKAMQQLGPLALSSCIEVAAKKQPYTFNVLEIAIEILKISARDRTQWQRAVYQLERHMQKLEEIATPGEGSVYAEVVINAESLLAIVRQVRDANESKAAAIAIARTLSDS